MNGRFLHEETPEGRLAAVAVALAAAFEDRHHRYRNGPTKPDVADLRDALRPYVIRELLKARIEEAEINVETRASRTAQLIKALYECEAKLPKDHRL